MVTITFLLNIVSLNKYDQGDERCLDFELLKNKKEKKISFPVLPGRHWAHRASADVSVDTDMVTLAILTVLLIQLSAAL